MLKPIEDKIVVKRHEPEQTTASGLVLAGRDEKINQGTVVAVGPGITLQNGTVITPDVKIGDEVVFATYGGTEIEHDGETLLVITIRDLLAVISND